VVEEKKNKAPREKAAIAGKGRPKPSASLDEEFGLTADEDVQGAAQKSVETALESEDPGSRSWRIAASMVNRYRPVPHLVWPIVHAVYGRSGEIGEADPMMFSTVSQLIVRSSADRALNPVPVETKSVSLTEAVRAVGVDVAAAICLIHAVCRRISNTVNDRVSRPILDDALLRAYIGLYVGQLSPHCGAGRGLLAGFAGRCGLAVQIAAGGTDQAGRALTGMASGQDMSEICNTVYGCDPLEVAALSLISGGCCREIAFGISSYSLKGKEHIPGSEQEKWLALFSVIEGARMGQHTQLPPSLWGILGYDETQKENLNNFLVKAQRRGHGWLWITQPQLLNAEEGSVPARTPEEIRQSRKDQLK